MIRIRHPKRGIKINKQCPLNFHQLYIHSSGEVYPCGFLQGQVSFGNITQNSLQEIWNSDKTKTFRRDHQEGKNSHCEKCQKLYNCHLLHENIWDRSNPPKQAKLKRLDIMIDSFCNLKCIMCTNRTEVNGGFLNDFFWHELEQNIIPQIEEIEVVGGEPLICKDTYRLMDLVIKVNPSIRWTITTNGHVDFGKNITSRLRKLNIHSFAVSIDSLDKDNFKIIRDGGKLETCLDFLSKLKNYKAENNLNFHIVCNFLVQKNNYKELRNFLNFQKNQNVKVYPILLREPLAFSIFSLPYLELLQILDDYIAIGHSHNNLYVKNMVAKITPFIKKVDIAKRIDKIQAMASYE